MKPKIYKLSEAEVNRMQLLSENKALVKIVEKNIDKRTPSGLILVSPTDTDWNPDVHVDRYGVIVKQVNSLKRKRNHLWKTTIETEPNDIVWYDYMIGANCDTIITESNEYKLLDYFDLIVSKRGDEIVPLNGYCLFSMVEDKVNSPLAIDTGKMDARLGILEYAGSCNEYYFDGLTDDKFLTVGHKCVFKNPPIMLESAYYACFNLKKQYRISQRYNINAVYVESQGEEFLYPTRDHVIIKPEYDTHRGLIEIPEIYRKPNGMGIVYASGVKELNVGDQLKYFPNACITIEYKGIKYQIAHQKDVLLKYD